MTALSLYRDLEARGILKQVTDVKLETALAAAPMTLYCGFDPTSDSLHVGSLLPLLTLRRFQLAGHRVIAVAGGATGSIGDPSGKTAERSLLTDEVLAFNLAGITRVISRFLELSGSNPARVVNNGDWFRDMTFIGFLRDVGKHFTVNYMMAKESVRARLEDREHGISFTEFSYMLLQAYDYLVLNERENCRLQIGGSDQWGNITAGTELIRRIRASRGEISAETGALPLEKECFGLTHPLVMKADGTKFGKSEKGTIWLDAKRTSPYQFYQYFLNTADADVLTQLKLFTFRDHAELTALEKAVQTEPAKRAAQIALARDMTELVHGTDELARAESASRALFGDSLRDLDEQTLLEVLGEAPSTKLGRDRLAAGLALVDLLVETGLCNGKGTARKDIQAGGIYVNNERVADPAAMVGAAQLLAGSSVVLRKGKRNYHLVRFS